MRVIAKLHTLLPRARLLLIGQAISRALVMSRVHPRVRRRARKIKRETLLSIVQLLKISGIILITGCPLKVSFKPELVTGFSGMRNKNHCFSKFMIDRLFAKPDIAKPCYEMFKLILTINGIIYIEVNLFHNMVQF